MVRKRKNSFLPQGLYDVLGDFMNRYVINFSYKHIKQIPRKVRIVWIIGAIVTCSFLIVLLMPYVHDEQFQNIELHIDEISLFDSYNTKSSRMKLNITSNGVHYYVWYPQNCFSKYADRIQSDLLSGNLSVVHAKVTSKQTLREKILNQRRVVDLRSAYSVYYELGDEIKQAQEGKQSLLLMLVVTLLLWGSSTIIILLVYRVFQISKRKSPCRHG